MCFYPREPAFDLLSQDAQQQMEKQSSGRRLMCRLTVVLPGLDAVVALENVSLMGSVTSPRAFVLVKYYSRCVKKDDFASKRSACADTPSPEAGRKNRPSC